MDFWLKIPLFLWTFLTLYVILNFKRRYGFCRNAFTYDIFIEERVVYIGIICNHLPWGYGLIPNMGYSSFSFLACMLIVGCFAFSLFARVCRSV